MLGLLRLCWVCLGQVQVKCSHNVRRFHITIVELESSNVMRIVWSCWVCLGQDKIKCSHNVRRFQINVVELESSNVMRTVRLCQVCVGYVGLSIRIMSEDSRLLLQNWNLLRLCKQSGYVRLCWVCLGWVQVKCSHNVRRFQITIMELESSNVMRTVWSCWVCLGQVQCSHNVRRFQITVVELESSNVIRTV